MASKCLAAATRTVFPTHPVGLQIDLLDECTGRCAYCNHRSWPRSILQLDRVLDILQDASELGFKSVSLSGGSPQLHPDFWHVVSAVKSFGMKVNVFTDGLRWNWDGITVSPDRLQFSIDTLDRESYIENRGVDGLKEAMCTVEGALKRRIPSRIMATVVPGKWREAIGMVDVVRELRKSDDGRWLDVRLYGVHDYGTPSQEEVGAALALISDEIIQHGVEDWNNLYQIQRFLANGNESANLRICVIAYMHRVVAADGYIFGCCYADRDNMPWREAERKRIRDSLGRVTDRTPHALLHSFDGTFELGQKIKRYRSMDLGDACKACASVNSRYTGPNADWNSYAYNESVFM